MKKLNEIIQWMSLFFATVAVVLATVLLISACENANANSGGCEGGTCEENPSCHCEFKMSEPKFFSGNKCSDEYPVMQGHMPVKLPNGQVVAGVQCRKIEHKCDCGHDHETAGHAE